MWCGTVAPPSVGKENWKFNAFYDGGIYSWRLLIAFSGEIMNKIVCLDVLCILCRILNPFFYWQEFDNVDFEAEERILEEEANQHTDSDTGNVEMKPKSRAPSKKVSVWFIHYNLYYSLWKFISAYSSNCLKCCICIYEAFNEWFLILSSLWGVFTLKASCIIKFAFLVSLKYCKS